MWIVCGFHISFKVLTFVAEEMQINLGLDLFLVVFKQVLGAPSRGQWSTAVEFLPPFLLLCAEIVEPNYSVHLFHFIPFINYLLWLVSVNKK